MICGFDLIDSLGGAREEIQLTNLQELIMDEVKKIRKVHKDLLESEVASLVTQALQDKGISLVQLEYDQIGKNLTPYADCIAMAASLSKARVALTRMPDPASNKIEAAKFAKKEHTVSVEKKLISKDHVSKVMAKK